MLTNPFPCLLPPANNFKLLRCLLAVAVLYSHCYPLSGEQFDPLARMVGTSFGRMAVDMFFVISGFLVTASLLNRGTLQRFFHARVLRIYPALIPVSLFSVFGIGLMTTSLDWISYLSHEGTYQYLWRNLSIVASVPYQLPGVFASNPYPRAVNGSLWTLRWELEMYLLLGMLAWLFLREEAGRSTNGFTTAIVVLAVAAMTMNLAVKLDPDLVIDDRQFIHLTAMFFSGALILCLRQHIPLRAPYLLAALLLLTALAGKNELFDPVYNLLLGYITLCLAFLPTGPLLRYENAGDYSYGIYIYAYPIQQTLMHYWPEMRAMELFMLSLPLTLLASAMSWHWLERPALKWKD